MEFWERVAGVDRKIDLLTASREDMQKNRCCPGGAHFNAPPTSPLYLPLDGFYKKRWRNWVLTFRFLAKRLYKVKTLPPGRMTLRRGLQLLRYAIRCLIPVCPFSSDCETETVTPDQTSVHTHLVVPTDPDFMPLVWHKHLSRYKSRGVDLKRVLDVDTFWLKVFASMMVVDVEPPRCSVCGDVLPRTKKGYRSRREECKKCYERAAYVQHKVDPKAHKGLQEKWKRNKAKQRTEQRMSEQSKNTLTKRKGS